MSVYRLLVTGSRECTLPQAEFVQEKLNTVRVMLDRGFTLVCVVQGEARGVDLVAGTWAETETFTYSEGHPALWREYGKRAGSIRNEHMVRLGAHVCLAFPGRDSIGTYDCIRRAKGAGIPTHVFPLPEVSEE